ncbi:hypothetical protein ZIOFF_046956 [Zingiber officinale]|uniref:Uncharacterized protein n=1 Tax=Zingiber officinale TaxID=94328 RepID=A0A8J5FQS9_ZINOF|nr:hypothetical protein ZIOFF_046956 [Zingiber officinale]
MRVTLWGRGEQTSNPATFSIDGTTFGGMRKKRKVLLLCGHGFCEIRSGLPGELRNCDLAVWFQCKDFLIGCVHGDAVVFREVLDSNRVLIGFNSQDLSTMLKNWVDDIVYSVLHLPKVLVGFSVPGSWHLYGAALVLRFKFVSVGFFFFFCCCTALGCVKTHDAYVTSEDVSQEMTEGLRTK